MQAAGIVITTLAIGGLGAAAAYLLQSERKRNLRRYAANKQSLSYYQIPQSSDQGEAISKRITKACLDIEEWFDGGVINQTFTRCPEVAERLITTNQGEASSE